MSVTDAISLLEVPTRAGLAMIGDAAGSETDPAVLFFPGGGQTRHSWRAALRAISTGPWRGAAFDLPGHGDSGWASDGFYSMQLFADCVGDVANAFDHPVLVGASLGGMAAMIAIGEEIVKGPRALVLVDATPRMEQAGSQRIAAFMDLGRDGFESLDDVADAIASFQPERPTARNHQGLKKNVRQRPDGRWVWHWDPMVLTSLRSQNDESDLGKLMRDAVHRVSVPTLLIRGASSDVVSDESVAELRELIPHVTVVDVANAGHMMAGSRNDRFNNAVMDFLSELST